MKQKVKGATSNHETHNLFLFSNISSCTNRSKAQFQISPFILTILIEGLKYSPFLDYL